MPEQMPGMPKRLMRTTGWPWERVTDLNAAHAEREFPYDYMVVMWQEDYRESVTAFLFDRGSNMEDPDAEKEPVERECYYDVPLPYKPGYAPESLWSPPDRGFLWDVGYVERSRLWMRENCGKGPLAEDRS